MNEDKIREAYDYFIDKKSLKFPSIFGDGKASEFICETMLNSR